MFVKLSSYHKLWPSLSLSTGLPSAQAAEVQASGEQKPLGQGPPEGPEVHGRVHGRQLQAGRVDGQAGEVQDEGGNHQAGQVGGVRVSGGQGHGGALRRGICDPEDAGDRSVCTL